MARLRVDPAADQSYTDQIRQQIGSHIYFGDLRVGDQLPSVRELADQLDIAKSTVHRIYAELKDRGILETRPGSGVYIASPREDKVTVDAARFRVLVESLDRARKLAMRPSHFVRQLHRLTGIEPARARFGLVCLRETYEILLEDFPPHVASCIEWISPHSVPEQDPASPISQVQYLITTFNHGARGEEMGRWYSKKVIALRKRPERCKELFGPPKRGLRCIVVRDREMAVGARELIAAGFTAKTNERVWPLHIDDGDLEWACKQAESIHVSPCCVDEFDARVGLRRKVIRDFVAPDFVHKVLYHMVFG